MSSQLKPRPFSLAEAFGPPAFGPPYPADLTVTGFEPSKCPFVPRRDRNFRWDREVLRDLTVWWEEGGKDPIHLFGPTGAGKSSAMRQFCAALNIPLYQKTMHQGVEFDQLVSYVELNEGSSVTFYSYLPLTMGAEGWPGIFLGNEIDRADSNLVVSLNDVLDGEALNVHLGGLEPVEPHPTFRFATTGNSALAGDMVGTYVSVRQQDMSSADRPWLVKVSYPEPALESEVLAAAVPELDQVVRTTMIEVAGDIRQAFMGESTSAQALPITMSTRALRRWARLTHLFRRATNPVAYALDRALLYRVDGMPEVRRAILELVVGRFGESAGKFV